MKTLNDPDDPKGLIHEAYRIEGITAGECRTIFLDWALSLSADRDVTGAIGQLLQRYDRPGHPMTIVLTEGLQTAAKPRRRGGWRARQRPD